MFVGNRFVGNKHLYDNAQVKSACTELSFTKMILITAVCTLTGCAALSTSNSTQNTSAVHQTVNNPVVWNKPTMPSQFEINGKIGVKSAHGAGSAFYTLLQQYPQCYSLNVQGILGVGNTDISVCDGLATLQNNKQQIQSNSAQNLLYQTTGWNAPVELLPYWLFAQPKDEQNKPQLDAFGRTEKLSEQGWQAQLQYADEKNMLPQKLVITPVDTNTPVDNGQPVDNGNPNQATDGQISSNTIKTVVTVIVNNR